MSKPSGIEAVVADMLGEGDEPFQPAAQLPLLAAEVAPDAPPAPAGGGRGGRPKGAKNKRTEDWVNFILGRYRSPLVGLAEVFSRPVGELAKELGCKPLEAFQLQLRAMDILAPYLHQRLPQAIQIDNKGLPLLAIGAFAGASAGPAGGLFGMIAEAQQNQALSVSREVELNGSSLTDDENASDAKGLDDATD
ncbi:hypothetical protein [Zavarzinia aquatilis]|uniref:Uncharacterized protein n=1 Tax=Zavarzinia aquatilis TaxID=2211142 RepID=A0A317EEC6_9PROT|nr:hypothetical protein [Zavarzinia aquatilis]PWR24972.1 hypothetical protein DKG74_04175 [Zavarzinia aquatilis]